MKQVFFDCVLCTVCAALLITLVVLLMDWSVPPAYQQPKAVHDIVQTV